ncbi:leucine-rich repeat-containing protein kinase family protein [Leptolyngbya sp. FACHB-711]|uniref:leucine-rich repeat-containing protein kinase family protein n=1 Tax=unclassified Leptolyngbya TaxID=2650499 RepID=UPI001683A3BE|nr:leucine-rich repeat-containing protein kinase family protein [Leptolyngbya sp. FACHB-711]MBD1848755.1 serine/threonine-protein kinase [Cyanobacteria bacterium FACHB-502]MBD2023317.1 serine/threonine-protein kinase [Leptolyngbya sp. FACHB-711]
MKTLDLLQTGQLAGTRRLNLAAELTEFPMEILELADSLEILDLSNNHLKRLPDEFRQLKKLKIVFLSNNDFEEVPEVLSQCPQLSMVGFKSNRITALPENALPPLVRWLILTDNRLQQLPASIGQLSRLQKLMLAGNELRSLPDELANCQNLELIRLAANQLTALPVWLSTLPRLSWLAYAGNPFCDSSRLSSLPDTGLPDFDSSNPDLLHIKWTDLMLGEPLGQGASGIIYQGTWNSGVHQSVEVAIKLFKGEITSDGFPLDEMRACIAAGTHPNLVRVLGKVIHHPTHSAGLVFSFIPPRYKNLGGPPSLETCTRDTYPPDTAFTLPVILRIAQGIAAATAHLHARGIMHGDLYAHNILVDETGESLLGDFGAACFYDPADRFLSRSLPSLEVRAFGCLLEDLLDRCRPAPDHPDQIKAIEHLRRLQQDCMNPVPALRPLLPQICAALAAFNNGS